MTFSIAVKLDAWGNVSVDVVDQLGGCPFTIAHREGRGGTDLEGIPSAEAVVLLLGGLEWKESGRYGGLRYQVEQAVRALAMCVPQPEFFDEEGRPIPRGKCVLCRSKKEGATGP